ncbi:MAG: 16S rRNA (cytosine(1402)-N(4))-methyltransferase RsmH [Patescibacteria group bacterium]
MHISVLTNEILEHFNLKPGENVIDATLDGGGHSKLFLRVVAPNGKVLGIEQDAGMIKSLKSEHLENLIVAQGNFRNIVEIARKHNFNPDAIFFDLGMSTWHIKESGRGFSFQRLDEPLDMRFSDEAEITAAEILNSYTDDKIAEIFKEYGEEKKARFWAKRIVEKRKLRKILTVGDLIGALGMNHPKVLARIFQSLRIFINDELNALSEGLSGAVEILNVGGRVAVLSYHSLEDRLVKNFFKGLEKEGKGSTSKKPIVPSIYEVRINPSARSAKLRIFIK